MNLKVDRSCSSSFAAPCPSSPCSSSKHAGSVSAISLSAQPDDSLKGGRVSGANFFSSAEAASMLEVSDSLRWCTSTSVHGCVTTASVFIHDRDRVLVRERVRERVKDAERQRYAHESMDADSSVEIQRASSNGCHDSKTSAEMLRRKNCWISIHLQKRNCARTHQSNKYSLSH